ncbi:uncharacterized protein SPPG_00567 [Spizellomyces punctatus DAOM BR117]|uniref:Uncharacterized protein n=1 Tax=Spizellomyces punctatus (strain DAOM BR117) TaxID=645134 RepID=A0A0L0HUQ8_SPIPD|nr:uncharacterized protein SPPG_00567 [Spizellomyces punctatus DAOM BR117]KND04868.1 hypothetical protein SPPG_00567 [Spizellomyces punctatus DAOM BR117]|eukprot:XP_016612907.1 hypothetical protein SPPG_00567 [Spizellomyces punctatus DAOM BR117]
MNKVPPETSPPVTTKTVPDIAASPVSPCSSSPFPNGTRSASESPVILRPARTFPPATDVTTVYLDAPRKSVVLLKNDEELELVREVGEATVKFSVGHKGAIRDVEVSSDGSFIGILRSAKVLDIMRINSMGQAASMQEIVKDARSSEAILGFEWTFPGELIAITNMGLDLYQYSESNDKFIRRKSKQFNVNWYSYWPDHHILITSVSSLTLKLYHLKGDASFDPLPPLHVVPRGKSNTLQVHVTKRQIAVLCAYGRLYCSFFDLTTEKPILVLYRITRASLNHEVSCHLQGRGTFIVNIVDNLLVVHNLIAKHPLLFDLKDASSQPIIPPKQLQMDEALGEWQACFSDCILMPSCGVLYELMLNLDAISKTMRELRSDFQVLEFLLRRKIEDPSLILGLVRDMLRAETEPGIMRKAFELLNTTGRGVSVPRGRAMVRDVSTESADSLASSRAGTGSRLPPAPETSVPKRLLSPPGSRASSRPSSVGGHRTPADYAEGIFSQEHMYALIFNVLGRESDFPVRYLTRCILEYIAALSATEPIQPYFHELLAELLVKDQRYAELHQYVQYNVVQDSIAVARLLLSKSAEYGPYQQLGLDMLKRMNANDDVVDILISRGQVLDALRFALSRNCLRTVSVTGILDSALASGDKTLFLNTFRCLEEQGLISSDISHEHPHTGLSPGGSGRYVSVFREMWGEVVEMDSLIDM